MNRRRILIPALLTLAGVSPFLLSRVADAADDKPIVIFDTTAGPITIELDRAKAPVSVENFLTYVDKHYYDGLVFHRVISDFMIQGGGFTDAGDMLKEKGQTLDPIKNESANGLSNKRGTIAMARTSDPDSATAQFYINVEDNGPSKPRVNLDRGRYAVFGKVIDGMDVVDAIRKTPTGSKNALVKTPRGMQTTEMGDVPTKPIMIKTARRKSAQP